MKQKILIIDDTTVYRESLKIVLKADYSVSASAMEEDIGKLIDNNEADIVIIGSDKSFDKAIPDFRNILNRLKEKSLILILPEKDEALIPYIPLKHICFLSRKAESVLDIPDVVSALVEKRKKTKNVPAIDKQIRDEHDIWLNMLPFIKISSKEHFFQSAKTTLPLFFRGANGMRGEDVARMIHHNSPMDGFNFVKIDCCDEDGNGIYHYIRDSLIEKDCICGTLFLEKIDELSGKSQQEIMGLIEGKNNFKHSGKKINNINVRIIASSPFGLKTLLKEKKIREELYYRLSIGNFSLFPLHEKLDEIPVIVKNLSSFFSYKYFLPDKTFSSSAIAFMQRYIWPANIDELISVVQRSMLFSGSDIIDEDDVMIMPLKSDHTLSRDNKDERNMANTAVESGRAEKKEDSEKVVKADLSHNIVINLAHEIKNPLVGIKTFATLLPEKYDDFEFRNDFFRIVNSDVDKIDSLIERIIEYENINNGTAEQLFVNDIVNEVIEEKKNIFDEKKLSFKIELEKENPKVKCSKDVFKYSVENLLYSLIGYCTQGNIIKFVSRITGENGSEKKVELEISVEEESGSLMKKSNELEEISVLLAKKAVGRYDGSVLYLKDYKNIFGYLLSMEKSE